MTWSELLTMTQHAKPSSSSTDSMDWSNRSVCMVCTLQNLAQRGRIVISCHDLASARFPQVVAQHLPNLYQSTTPFSCS